MQTQVAEFVKLHQLETDVSTRMLDLVSEVGELAKEILKATDYGKRPFEPNEKWADELGDVLFALVCVANRTEVDLEQSLAQVLAKYQSRLDADDDAGSGQ